MRQHLAVALVIIAAVGACASEAVEEAFNVTDSAGVSIAVSHAPLWPEGRGWRLEGQPSVLIGGGITDTTAIVGPIAGAMRLPDGRILVADEGATRLRWFADDGTILQSVGRQGEGPGEFRRLESLLHAGDTIAVYDGRTGQVSLFSMDGAFARKIRLSIPPGGYFGPKPVGRLATGEWISRVDMVARMDGVSGVIRDSTHVWLNETSGTLAKHVSAVPGPELMKVFVDGEFSGSRALLGHRTTIRFHDGALWAGTGDAFQVDQVNLNGETHRSVRLAVAPAPVSAAEIDALIDSAKSRYAGMSDPRWKDAFTRTLEAAPRPTVKPAYSTFTFDDAANLWIERYGAGPELPSSWVVIDTAGRWLGDVTLPPGFEPTHIGTDEVLGIWTDPDGLQRVVGYPLIRDSTGM